jgi:hypothetical protein
MILNIIKTKKILFFLGLITLLILTFFFYASEELIQSSKKTFFQMKHQMNIFATTQIFSTLPTTLSDSDRLNEFYKIHERIFSQSNLSLRKISFNGQTAGGYGNKLYSFLTSLIIAILTESQIVLKWNHIDKYVKTPINIFDNISENSGLNDAEFKSKSIYFVSSQAWSPNKNVESLMKTSVPAQNYLRYFYSSIDPYFMEICTNPFYFPKLLYFNLTSKETVNSALNIISSKNSTQIEKQEKVFQVGFEVGGNLLNRFWCPNEAILKQIDFFMDKYFKNNFVIGLQLRYGDGNPNQIYLNEKNETDTIKFIKCARDIEREYILRNEMKNNQSFKWFIASDSAVHIDSILKNYPTSFTSNGTLKHVAYDSDGYMRTIIDVELLSRCNELIITGGSTFGWIAAMKMQKMPFFINGFSQMEKCLRANLGDKLPKTPTNYLVFK